MTPEQKLFQAIVLQCFKDACAAPLPKPQYDLWAAKWRAKKPNASDQRMSADWKYALEQWRHQSNTVERDRVDAKRWLTTRSRDFDLICGLAQLDPDYIYDNAKKLERNGWAHSANLRLAA
jgi:hypothetical protein